MYSVLLILGGRSSWNVEFENLGFFCGKIQLLLLTVVQCDLLCERGSKTELALLETTNADVEVLTCGEGFVTNCADVFA
jgi:hypothetical protein